MRTKVWNGGRHAIREWNACILTVTTMADNAIEGKYTHPFIDCFRRAAKGVYIASPLDRYVVLNPLDTDALEFAWRSSAASQQRPAKNPKIDTSHA